MNITSARATRKMNARMNSDLIGKMDCPILAGVGKRSSILVQVGISRTCIQNASAGSAKIVVPSQDDVEAVEFFFYPSPILLFIFCIYLLTHRCLHRPCEYPAESSSPTPHQLDISRTTAAGLEKCV